MLLHLLSTYFLKEVMPPFYYWGTQGFLNPLSANKSFPHSPGDPPVSPWGGTYPSKRPEATEGVGSEGAQGTGGAGVVTLRRNGVLGDCSGSGRWFVAGRWDAASVCPQL